MRDELPDAPGEKIVVVGCDEQPVPESICWMERPGVEFKRHDADSILRDPEIPEDKSVVVQAPEVQIENIEEGDLI